MWKNSVGVKLLELLDGRDRRWVVLLLVMMFVGALLEVVGIGLIVPFIGILSDPGIIQENEYLASLYAITGQKGSRVFLTWLGVALLCAYLIKNIYMALLINVQSRFLFRKQASLAKNLLHSYIYRPYTFHLQRDTATLLRNIIQEAVHVINGVMLPTFQLLTEVVVLFMVIAFLFFMEPLVASITMLALGAAAVAINLGIGSILARQGKERKEFAGHMIKWVQHGLGGIKESKVLGREAYFIQQFDESSMQYVRSSRIYAILNAAPRLIIETVVVVVLLLVVLIVLNRDVSGQSIIPILALFAVAAIRLMPSVNRMIIALNSIRFHMPALEAYCEELARLSIESTPSQFNTNATKSPHRIDFSAIKVEGLHYRYESSDAEALSGIDMVIKQGESVALTGPSGSGKSTLIDMLLGLHQPTRGRIIIGDTLLTNMISEWQQSVGYVPQSIYLTDGAIISNVAFGIPEHDIDYERVKSALDKAGLSGLVEKLPEGIHTHVGERGTRLSGGEKQRIGIARALYHDAKVLVFDEATSALDNETERLVARVLKDLAGERTIIIIAHRLDTVRLCDTIHVIDSGKVVESGSYSELIKRQGMFSHMVNAHSYTE